MRWPETLARKAPGMVPGVRHGEGVDMLNNQEMAALVQWWEDGNRPAAWMGKVYLRKHET